MKHSFIRLICLFCAAIPIAASSQTNIMAAFDDIIKCKDASITETHSLERDPSTTTKIGQCDVWEFCLPADKIKLVKNVISAFGKDNAKAYSLNSGTAKNPNIKILLAIGEDGTQSVDMTEPGYDYIYSLFIAPTSEDPNGNHRYAYGMNHVQADGKITGKLVVTYATTLKYRQEQEKNNELKIFGQFSDGSTTRMDFTPQQQSWFSTFMSYIQGLSEARPKARIALATKAYEHIGTLKDDNTVSAADKDTAREILKKTISDKRYSDPVLNQLLNSCLLRIE